MKPREVEPKTLSELKSFYRAYSRLPTYSELAKIMGYASKNAAFRLADKLVKSGILEKDPSGRLRPRGAGFGLPLAGYVQAGFPSPAEEELIDTLSLDDYLIRKPEASFLLKVTGDSMIDAGIHQGDLVIVERGHAPKNGDVVLAQVDREWTLKYFYRRKGKVTLVAANKNYPEITAKEELTIAGIVRGVVRRY